MYQDQISLTDFLLQEVREKCFEIQVKVFKQCESTRKSKLLKERNSNIQQEINTRFKKKPNKRELSIMLLSIWVQNELMNLKKLTINEDLLLQYTLRMIDDGITEFQAIIRHELNSLEFEAKIEFDQDQCLEERTLLDKQFKITPQKYLLQKNLKSLDIPMLFTKQKIIVNALVEYFQEGINCLQKFSRFQEQRINLL